MGNEHAKAREYAMSGALMKSLKCMDKLGCIKEIAYEHIRDQIVKGCVEKFKAGKNCLIISDKKEVGLLNSRVRKALIKENILGAAHIIMSREDPACTLGYDVVSDPKRDVVNRENFLENYFEGYKKSIVLEGERLQISSSNPVASALIYACGPKGENERRDKPFKEIVTFLGQESIEYIKIKDHQRNEKELYYPTDFIVTSGYAADFDDLKYGLKADHVIIHDPVSSELFKDSRTWSRVLAMGEEQSAITIYTQDKENLKDWARYREQHIEQDRETQPIYEYDQYHSLYQDYKADRSMDEITY